MTTLGVWLERGLALREERVRANRQGEAAREAENAAKEAQMLADLEAVGRKYLGAAFDELATGKRQAIAGYDRATIELIWGPGPVLTELRQAYAEHEAVLYHRLGRNEYHKLRLPADEPTIALYLAECKANFDAARDAVIERAKREITAPDRDYFDGDPQKAMEFYLAAWPDIGPDLAPALEAEMARRAAVEAEQRTRREHHAEVQGKVWYDFTVWVVRYAARASAGEEDEEADDLVKVETLYSLAPYPDSDGWWPAVKRGEVVRTRVGALLSVAEQQVRSWDDELAKRVCRRVDIDGVNMLVLQPPQGAVVVEGG